MRQLSPLRYFGVYAAVSGWATILASMILNPWFSIVRNALSDMGAIGVKYAWVFNSGLMISGALAFLYSAYLLLALGSRLGILASSIMLLASIHLILIGLFPEGTYPHLFVSMEFFILMGASILLLGVAFLMSEARRYGVCFAAMATAGFLAAILVPWPSIGSLEIFEISLMTLWSFLMLRLV